MCGIGGVTLFPKHRSKEELDYIRGLVKNIMIENEVRGRDSAGVAVLNKKSNRVIKQPMKASLLAETGVFQRFLNESICHDTYNILIHTRAGTKGSEQDNNNNHPIVTKEYIGVHNGMIYNDDKLFKDENLFRLARVDSEVIFRLLDKYGKYENGDVTVAEKLGGMYTYAYVEKEMPSVMTLVKHNNPATMVYIEKLNLMAFASMKNFLVEAIKVTNAEHGYRCFVLEDEFEAFEPKADTILRFDAKQDNALEQLQQVPQTFNPSNEGNYYWYDDFGYDDWYNYGTRQYATSKLDKEGEREESESKKTIKGIYEKLTAEEIALLESYVEEEKDYQWNVGWSAGRSSLDDVVELDKAFAREEGYNKGYEEGYEDCYKDLAEDSKELAN